MNINKNGKTELMLRKDAIFTDCMRMRIPLRVHALSRARVYCTTIPVYTVRTAPGPSRASERSSSTAVRVWFMRMCRSMCLCCFAGAAQTVRVYEIHALVVEYQAHSCTQCGD